MMLRWHCRFTWLVLDWWSDKLTLLWLLRFSASSYSPLAVLSTSLFQEFFYNLSLIILGSWLIICVYMYLWLMIYMTDTHLYTYILQIYMTFLFLSSISFLITLKWCRISVYLLVFLINHYYAKLTN